MQARRSHSTPGDSMMNSPALQLTRQRQQRLRPQPAFIQASAAATTGGPPQEHTFRIVHAHRCGGDGGWQSRETAVALVKSVERFRPCSHRASVCGPDRAMHACPGIPDHHPGRDPGRQSVPLQEEHLPRLRPAPQAMKCKTNDSRSSPEVPSYATKSTIVIVDQPPHC